MSWRDNLRPGSFRGAAFKIRGHDAEGGRRGEQHSFPGREDPWFEDLGRAPKRWSIEAIVVGADYMRERDALEAALEAHGPGSLVHPYLGSLSAVCTTYSFAETTSEGGMATFKIEFAEPGSLVPAAAGADTAAIALDTAAEAREAAAADFGAEFSIEDQPGWVAQEGRSLVERVTGRAGGIAATLGGAGARLRAFEAGLMRFPRAIDGLMREPLNLGHAVVGLILSVARLGAMPGQRIRALLGLVSEAKGFADVIGGTPSRRRQRENQRAFQKLIVRAAAAEIVAEVAELAFASYDEAVRMRTELADALDVSAVALADAGDDSGAEAVDALRLVMVRDVTARGGSLVRLFGYVPNATEPALAIAQRLYGDPEYLIADADEIVGRNRIRHPGFVTGGARLEVRTGG